MNVFITDTPETNVSCVSEGANVFGYRMFDTVLVIFIPNIFFIIPFSKLHGVQNKTNPVSSRVCIRV